MNLFTIVVLLFQTDQSGIAAIPPALMTNRPPLTNSVAKVNGIEIKADEVDRLTWEWRHREVEQDLIDFLVVKTAAKKAGIAVSPEEVDAEIQAYLKRYQAPPGKTAEQALEAQGVPRSRLFLKIRSQLLLRKLQLAEFHPEEFVKVSTAIYGAENERPEILAQDMKRAQTAYEQLSKGTPWQTVLASSTNRPEVLSSGGLIGWRPKKAFPDAVRIQFDAAKPGTYTKPAQTQNGIQIFRVEQLGSAAKPSDIEELKGAYLTSSRTEFIKRLTATAKIERY